jgi:hypothetical protein
MAWLGRFSSAYRRAFDAIFGPLWMHILMHAGLFAVLALLLTHRLSNLRIFAGWKLPMLVTSAVLGLGLLQEGLQSLSGGVFLPSAAAFDLGVDFAGGLVGLGIAQGIVLFRRAKGWASN